MRWLPSATPLPPTTKKICIVAKSGCCAPAKTRTSVDLPASFAARDLCATLRATSEITAAIAINRYKDGEAFFTALLTSRSRPVFAAQTIVGSGPILDGSIYSIEFAGANGEEHIVTIPTIIIRDYLPMFQKLVPPASPKSPPTGYFHIPKTYKTAAAASTPFVCVMFDDDPPPLGFSPEDARQLAGELLELAEGIDARSNTTH